MSAYMQDLGAALNAPDIDEFAARWLDFSAAHYPGAGPVEAFVDVAALLRGQIDPASWWRLMLRVCEARLMIARTGDLMFEYAGLIARLRDPLGLSTREILDATRQLRALAAPSERWQLDHLLNSYHWQMRERETVLARQAAFLAAGEIDSLYGVELQELGEDRGEYGGAGAGPMTGEGPAPGGAPWSFNPATRPELWRACAWEIARDKSGLHLSGPFGYDTNHTGGAGLFALLAACDFRRLAHPMPGLEGAGLRVVLSTALTRPARILIGLSAEERDPASGATTGLSAYNLLDRAIPDGETAITLSATDPGWRDMGGNPYSPPHLRYRALAMAEILARPMGLYLMLMQDDDPAPKEGTVTLGAMTLAIPG